VVAEPPEPVKGLMGFQSVESKRRFGDSMIKLVILIVTATLLIGCGPSRQDEKPPLASEKYQIGETVYVCGCPMMCCNSISRNPNGRCACNMPLKKGIVTNIQGHILLVTISGREKIVFLKNR
jgi:hypothetical protein